MELDDLLNRLFPYRVRRTATGELVAAQFAPTTAQDAQELRGPGWAVSRFREVWPVFAGQPHTLKFVFQQETDQRIQGIISLGRVPPGEQGLQASLLESAPWNQSRRPDREYAGVGRQLVLRLILECLRQGGDASILVRPSPGSEGFYRGLGFIELLPGDTSRMLLGRLRAFRLLREALEVAQ